MRKNLNTYYIFINVCDYRKYTKVAEILGYASHKIIGEYMQEYANRLGVGIDKLFVRNSRGVTPTDEALELSAKIKAALQTIDNAESEFCKAHNSPEPSDKVCKDYQPSAKICQSCAGLLARMM